MNYGLSAPSDKNLPSIILGITDTVGGVQKGLYEPGSPRRKRHGDLRSPSSAGSSRHSRIPAPPICVASLLCREQNDFHHNYYFLQYIYCMESDSVKNNPHLRINEANTRLAAETKH